VLGAMTVLKLSLAAIAQKKKINNDKNIQTIFGLIDDTAQETRDIVESLASNNLQEQGLMALLLKFYQDIEQPTFLIQSFGVDKKLSSDLEMILYSIIREGINNILKYANANQVAIQLTEHDNEFRLIIEDDGIGFDVANTKQTGHGLANMALRVREQLKGIFLIESVIGSGTIIIVNFRTDIFSNSSTDTATNSISLPQHNVL
jgi:signal transduction histidine kinase